jgi:hypothetical protein
MIGRRLMKMPAMNPAELKQRASKSSSANHQS